VSFRVAGASLVLLMLARISGSLQMIETSDWPLLIASSVLGLILNQLLSTKGLSLTTAINATLLSTTIPVFTCWSASCWERIALPCGAWWDRARRRRVLYLIEPAERNSLPRLASEIC